MAQPLPAMASVGNLVRDWNDWVNNFFKTYITPLNQCTKELLKQFSNVSNEFMEYVRLIHDLTGEILSRAGSTAGSTPTTCSVERFLEYAVNSSAGHNPFMFFAWSIRTTTPIHFRTYYGDPSNYAEVLNRLGYTKLQNAPQPANSCPGCDLNEYALHGYPDWVINGNIMYKDGNIYLDFEEGAKNKFINNATTLGGLLARLNEAVWSMINNVDWLSTLYYYRQGGANKPLKTILINYMNVVTEKMQQISDQYRYHYICNTLPNFCNQVITSISSGSLTTLFNALDNKFSSDYIREKPKYHIYLIHSNDACDCQAAVFEHHYYSLHILHIKNVAMPWCSYMDMVIPQVMLGRLELMSVNMSGLRGELHNWPLTAYAKDVLSQAQFIGAYTVLMRW